MTQQFELPDQSVSKKDERWHVAHANAMIQYLEGNIYSERCREIRKLEDDYLATPIKRESMTKPHGEDIGVKYDVYPLTEGVLDDITGNYLARPPKRQPYSINRDAINSKLDAKVDMIMEQIFREQNEQINQDANLNLTTDNPDMQMPDDVKHPAEIEEFFSKNYKTSAEELTVDLITQFLDVNKNIDKIKPMLTEYLYGETCACEIVEENGHPMLNTYRYDECYFDVDPSKVVQDDINVWATWKYYTETEIYNKFVLDRRQKAKVRQAFQGMEDGSLRTDSLDYRTVGSSIYSNCAKGISYQGWHDMNDKSHRLRVLTMKWKSRRDVKTLIYTDKDGVEHPKLLDNDYKPRKRDKGRIRTTSIDTLHEVSMLGPSILLEWGELPVRYNRIDNPSKAYLPVMALVGRTYLKDTQVRSMAQKLRPLQQFASDIMFQMRAYIKKIDGKVLIYDAAQIPKKFIETHQYEGALNRMLTHMRRDGVAFINSADKKQGHVFNQFSSVDLSNRGLFKDLTDGLFLVEQLAEKYSGFNKEARDGGDKYQTATSVNRAIISTNNRVGVHFEPFDSFIGSMLTRFMQVAKEVYQPGEVFQLTFGDVMNKFLTISKDLHLADIGIYISDSAKNFRDKQVIDGAAQMALSNAQDPKLILDLIDVLENDSATESKAIFQRSVKALEEMQEQARQDAKAAQDAQYKDKQEERAHVVEENQKDREKDITVAKIQAGQKAETEKEKIQSSDRQKKAELEMQQAQSENQDRGASESPTAKSA